MLVVDKISMFYGQYQALREVSLTMGEGELVMVLGPNGHGKSTLLKTICGLEQASSGSIQYEGEELRGLPSPKIVSRGVVYVAENRHLFPAMTVRENLLMGAYPKHAWKDRRESLDYVFELFPKLKAWKEEKERYRGQMSIGKGHGVQP